MAKIKQQTLGIVKTPPKFSSGLVLAGDIPGMQDYDASSGSHYPDYTLTPLVIDPEIGIMDLDDPLLQVDGRATLCNMHWYELDAAGNQTEIVVSGNSSTPPGYSMCDVTEGSPTAGRLKVEKNVSPSSPLRLRFTAQSVYGPDVFDVIESITVKCRDQTPAVSCMFDVADIVSYNPIHDSRLLPVELTVLENGNACDPSHFIPVWETREADGSWREYGTETCLDYWLDIAADKMSATLDMEHMGYGCSIRVRLRYDRDGDPSSVTLAQDDISVPYCRFECSRTLGDWQDRLVRMTNSLGSWVEEIRPEVLFKDNQGDIANPDDFFFVTMYASAPGKSLTASDKVGTGRSVSIKTARGSSAGIQVGYSVEVYTPLLPLMVDGRILCIDGNRPLLVRTLES